jgi:hypothetical protein
MLRTSFIGPPRFPAGSETTRVGERVDDYHARQTVTATCGCRWIGLVSLRGCAYSDGTMWLCDEHGVPDDDE